MSGTTGISRGDARIRWTTARDEVAQAWSDRMRSKQLKLDIMRRIREEALDDQQRKELRGSVKDHDALIKVMQEALFGVYCFGSRVYRFGFRVYRFGFRLYSFCSRCTVFVSDCTVLVPCVLEPFRYIEILNCFHLNQKKFL